MESGGAGTLFVVATPIGNLEDITLRALRVLREVAGIAAEDTRRTGNLLRHYGISTRLVSLHRHNEHQRLTALLRRLEQGESIALVSDAGTPGISDPGAILVRAARDAGFRVEPVPGPSAITAALSASGLDSDRFVFAGFAPFRSKDRNDWLRWVSDHTDVPVVCFEAPHRLQRTLRDLRQLVKRPIILARELTKIHETWIDSAADDSDGGLEGARGEYVLIVRPQTGPPAAAPTPSDTEIAELFGQIAKIPVATRREAIRSVAIQLRISVRKVYESLERSRSSGK